MLLHESGLSVKLFQPVGVGDVQPTGVRGGIPGVLYTLCVDHHAGVVGWVGDVSVQKFEEAVAEIVVSGGVVVYHLVDGTSPDIGRGHIGQSGGSVPREVVVVVDSHFLVVVTSFGGDENDTECSARAIYGAVEASFNTEMLSMSCGLMRERSETSTPSTKISALPPFREVLPRML